MEAARPSRARWLISRHHFSFSMAAWHSRGMSAGALAGASKMQGACWRPCMSVAPTQPVRRCMMHDSRAVGRQIVNCKLQEVPAFSDAPLRRRFLFRFVGCPWKAPVVDLPPPGLRWVSGIEQNRTQSGLVDLSQTPTGTFFREMHLISEMACQHRPNRRFPAVCDLTPKARKRFFTKVLSQRAHIFVYRRP